jgi:hypothetical protein
MDWFRFRLSDVQHMFAPPLCGFTFFREPNCGIIPYRSDLVYEPSFSGLSLWQGPLAKSVFAMGIFLAMCVQNI